MEETLWRPITKEELQAEQEILAEEHSVLTKEEKQILKYLKKIDNLYKKHNISLELFANDGQLEALKVIDGEEYCMERFYNIYCDGGDDGSHPDYMDIY